MNILDRSELATYAATRKNTELFEDINHLVDLDIVASAIGSTENGYNFQRLPARALFNLSLAFTVYRDEFQTRCGNEDVNEGTNLVLLKSYYECVKAIRTLNKYINRYIPTEEKDYTASYTLLSESKEAAAHTSSVVGG